MADYSNLHLGRTTFGNPANQDKIISIEDAMALLNDWVPNERLRLHMRQVAALMKAWALESEQKNESESYKWYLAGLLHDADWETFPNDHCKIIIEELEKRNVCPDVLRCIASHGPRYFGVQPITTMEKMIYVFDELSGFVHAASLVRPTKYEGMDVQSVKKKLKSPSFAPNINRDDITDAFSRITISIDEIIAFILSHQPTVA